MHVPWILRAAEPSRCSSLFDVLHAFWSCEQHRRQPAPTLHGDLDEIVAARGARSLVSSSWARHACAAVAPAASPACSTSSVHASMWCKAGAGRAWQNISCLCTRTCAASSIPSMCVFPACERPTAALSSPCIRPTRVSRPTGGRHSERHLGMAAGSWPADAVLTAPHRLLPARRCSCRDMPPPARRCTHFAPSFQSDGIGVGHAGDRAEACALALRMAREELLVQQAGADAALLT